VLEHTKGSRGAKAGRDGFEFPSQLLFSSAALSSIPIGAQPNRQAVAKAAFLRL
jgi:hypothetical protein